MRLLTVSKDAEVGQWSWQPIVIPVSLLPEDSQHRGPCPEIQTAEELMFLRFRESQVLCWKLHTHYYIRIIISQEVKIILITISKLRKGLRKVSLLA